MNRTRPKGRIPESGGTIGELRFCVPILIGKNMWVIDEEVRLEAGKLLGNDRAPLRQPRSFMRD